MTAKYDRLQLIRDVPRQKLGGLAPSAVGRAFGTLTHRVHRKELLSPDHYAGGRNSPLDNVGAKQSLWRHCTRSTNPRGVANLWNPGVFDLVQCLHKDIFAPTLSGGGGFRPPVYALLPSSYSVSRSGAPRNIVCPCCVEAYRRHPRLHVLFLSFFVFFSCRGSTNAC